MSIPSPPDSNPLRGPVHTLRRRLRAPLAALGVRLAAALFRLLPWGTAQRLGRGLGRLAWWISRRDRRRALDHLEIAFPERTLSGRTRLARDCFLHLGTVLGEMLWLFSRDCEALLAHVRVEGLERIEALRAAGRPILYFTGHCGNWELLGAAIACEGLPVGAVARSLDEPRLQEMLTRVRERFELLRALRRGAVGMVIDQDTKVEGVWVPFFGRPAYTPVGAARLALRRDAAVIPAFIERLADGSHLARFAEPLDLPDDEVEATARMTRAIEDQVRKVPEQWVWMHRRWRRRPPEDATRGAR